MGAVTLSVEDRNSVAKEGCGCVEQKMAGPALSTSEASSKPSCKEAYVYLKLKHSSAVKRHTRKTVEGLRNALVSAVI